MFNRVFSKLKRRDCRIPSGLPLLLAVVCAGSPMMAVAAEVATGSRVVPVQFAKDATTTTLNGGLKGEQHVDYRVRGGANQTLSVTLKPSNPQNYFNINPPGTEVSMYIGSTSGNQFKRILPTDGDYTIRVYLMRAAARRNETGSYTLNIALEGKPLAAVPAAKDALIRGTPFHASGNIACVRPSNPQIKRCDGYVIRRGFDGTATLEVRWPDGMMRNILFVKGQPIASDSPETMTFARRGADITTVSVGNDERADIPDVLITGG